MAEAKKLVQVHREDGSLSRTQAVNGAVIALGSLVGLMPELRSQIDPDWYPWIFVGLSVVNAYLRATTTQGLR